MSDSVLTVLMALVGLNAAVALVARLLNRKGE